MAIVQISRITQRKGLQENLPQLAGAEFGWSIDERRLFIGNGTLEEGAPVIGNTEILTEFSDILAFQTNYTYKGAAAGYVVQTGSTAGTPVSQSLQSWLDQFATVTDFGAVGDGVADDTDAINRALYQLFCREVNPQIRRSLFFPAGVYRVTGPIDIPPYATLYGEGADNTIIQLDDSTASDYVARTVDSLQQSGVNVGTNGAQAPTYITVTNMGFRNLDPTTDVFLVEDATNCRFQNVTFTGPLGTADLDTDGADTAGIRFLSTPSLVTSQIVFDGCQFSGTTFGIATEQQTNGVTVSNSKFDTLYKGIVLGVTAPVNGGPTGTRIVQNLFDNIYAQGIILGDISLNATGHNIFYDVGNYFNGVSDPRTTIIEIFGDNNISVGDMFERADIFAVNNPRISLNFTQSIAFTNGKQLQMGVYTRDSGLRAILNDDTASPTTIFTSTLDAFSFEYRIYRDTAVRKGVITVTNLDGVGLSYVDDFTENISTGITLSVTQTAGVVSVKYTSTSNTFDADISYSITRI